ncbi:MAG TPA: type II secretion system protein [Acidimicrobiia bacterium]|nr:type II secretion system protein [Acidimicrobiia bacterium]
MIAETMRRFDEAGETLLEIVLAMVIIGLVVSSFFASYATASTGSTAHRNIVTADGVLRNYAEAIKSAVRDTNAGCGAATPSTFTASYTPAAGFTVTASPGVAAQACPSISSVLLEHLTVTMPNGHTSSLDIEVRTP